MEGNLLNYRHIGIRDIILSPDFKRGMMSYINEDSPDFDQVGEPILYEMGRQFSSWCMYNHDFPKLTRGGLPTSDGIEALALFNHEAFC